MSTRSRIAIKTKTGYRSIYCHSDGSPGYNGRILLLYYSNLEKLKQLIKLGDMSSLDHIFDYEKRPKGVCTFYRRDRGDTNVKARTAKTLEELFQHANDCYAEYVYLWDSEKWFFSEVSYSTEQLRFRLLTAFDVLYIKDCPIVSSEPLIAADWLEEHGREQEALKIREFMKGA